MKLSASSSLHHARQSIATRLCAPCLSITTRSRASKRALPQSDDIIAHEPEIGWSQSQSGNRRSSTSPERQPTKVARKKRLSFLIFPCVIRTIPDRISQHTRPREPSLLVATPSIVSKDGCLHVQMVRLLVAGHAAPNSTLAHGRRPAARCPLRIELHSSRSPGRSQKCLCAASDISTRHKAAWAGPKPTLPVRLDSAADMVFFFFAPLGRTPPRRCTLREPLIIGPRARRWQRPAMHSRRASSCPTRPKKYTTRLVAAVTCPLSLHHLRRSASAFRALAPPQASHRGARCDTHQLPREHDRPPTSDRAVLWVCDMLRNLRANCDLGQCVSGTQCK